MLARSTNDRFIHARCLNLVNLRRYTLPWLSVTGLDLIGLSLTITSAFGPFLRLLVAITKIVETTPCTYIFATITECDVVDGSGTQSDVNSRCYRFVFESSSPKDEYVKYSKI